MTGRTVVIGTSGGGSIMRGSAMMCPLHAMSRPRGSPFALAVVVVLYLAVQATAQSPRYTARQIGDIVELRDARADVKVSVLTPVSNAYEIVVKGQDILRKPFASLDQLRASPGLNGVPLLWPFANRLDEQAFYANGTKYSFDPGIGNTGRGAIPIHGYLTSARDWKVVEANAGASGAWVTSRLEFFRNPRYMKQFPFAHVLTMTYRLSDGRLEVRTRIENLSQEPLPVTIGFHPYCQLTDSARDAWTLSLAARTHWRLDDRKIPTGENEPIERLLPAPARVPLAGVALDDVFSDLVRDADGRATMTLSGVRQAIDVALGPKFRTVVVYTPPLGGRGATGSPAEARGSIAIEPMAGITDAMNLAHRGLYRDLQSIPPGGVWDESFWITPRGF
ncbi:MAG: aldose 1-epimerase [Acidobacteria bacterium]|nr:aldose 1-epimerase [Acidobacteriota bacterium]